MVNVYEASEATQTRINAKKGGASVEDIRGINAGNAKDSKYYNTPGFNIGESAVPDVAEQSMLSTESAVDTVKDSQDKEKYLTGAPDDVTTEQDNKADSASIEDITKFLEEDGTPLPAALSPEGQKYRQELDTLTAGLSSFVIGDKELRTQMKTITKGWDARIKQMEGINERREKTFETLGFRTGGQFSGGIRGGVFGGIVSAEEREGLMRVSQLEASKQADLLKAKESARTNNWNVYVQQVAAAEKKYTDQIDTITKLNEAYITRQNELKEEEEALNTLDRQVKLDNSISQLVSEGIDDPKDILNKLNYDSEGTLAGNVTLKEVKEAVKFLQDADPNANATASVKEFLTFFPGTDLKSTEGYGKYLRFKAQVAAAGRAPSKGSSTKKTSEKVLSFEDWKNTDEAVSLTAQMQGNSFVPKSMENALQSKYDNYVRDYYQNNAEPGTNLTAGTIPTQIKQDLIYDINQNASLDELYEAYPEVSTSYLSSLFNSLKKKEDEDTAGDAIDVKSFLDSEDE